MRTKNLGLVKAIHVGADAPTNKNMLWYDTVADLHKLWSEVIADWVEIVTRDRHSWKTSVISISNVPPTEPEIGDRYMVGTSPIGIWIDHENNLVEYIGLGYSYYQPVDGDTVIVEDEPTGFYLYAGTGWAFQERESTTASYGLKKDNNDIQADPDEYTIEVDSGDKLALTHSQQGTVIYIDGVLELSKGRSFIITDAIVTGDISYIKVSDRHSRSEKFALIFRGNVSLKNMAGDWDHDRTYPIHLSGEKDHTPKYMEVLMFEISSDDEHIIEIGRIPFWEDSSVGVQTIDNGLLYNAYAVGTGNLAPTGWRVPTETDFDILIAYIGGEDTGEDTGGRLKTREYWALPNFGASDEYNFSALGAGFRGYVGAFALLNSQCFYWSSTVDGENIITYELINLGINIIKSSTDEFHNGYSVRCVRDATVDELLLSDGDYCDNVVDASSNSYRTVKIGTQVWMAENLKTTKYNNDTDIPLITNNIAWSEDTEGAYCSYGNASIVSYNYNNPLIIQPTNGRYINIDKILETVTKRFTSDAEMNSKEPLLPATPTDPEGNYLNGNREWKPILIGSAGYAANLYLTDIDSSDIETYKQISYTNDLGETIISKTVNNEEALIVAYLFELPIGITTVDAGSWRMSLWGCISSALNTSRFKFEVFKMNTSEEETVLFSAYSESIENTLSDDGYKRIIIESHQPVVTINATDRLGVKIYANTEATDNRTFYYKVGDENSSYANTPLALRHDQMRGKNDNPDYQHITTAEKLRLSGRGTTIAIASNDITIPASGETFLITGTDEVNSITIDNTHADSFKINLIFNSAVTINNKAVTFSGSKYPIAVSGDVNYTTRAGETLIFILDATGQLVRETGSRSQADVEIDDNIVLTLGVLASEPEEAEDGDTYYNSTSKKVFTYTTAWDAGVTPTANVIYADIVNALNYIWNGTDLEQTSLGIMYIEKTNKRVGFNTTKPMKVIHAIGEFLSQVYSTALNAVTGYYFKTSTNIANESIKGAILFKRTGTYGRGEISICLENTANLSNVDINDSVVNFKATEVEFLQNIKAPNLFTNADTKIWYVEPINGNDTNGANTHLFKTPESAVAQASSGDLVVFLPGTHTVTTTDTNGLAKEGVNYYCYGGAILTKATNGYMFASLYPTTIDISIYGNGQFIKTAGTGGLFQIEYNIINSETNVRLCVVESDKAISNNYCFYSMSNCYVKCNHAESPTSIVYNPSRCIFEFGEFYSTAGIAINLNYYGWASYGSLIFRGQKCKSATGKAISSPQTTSKIFIDISEIIGVGTDVVDLTNIGTANCVINSNYISSVKTDCNTIINCDYLYSLTVSGGLISGNFNAQFITMSGGNVEGNIYSNNNGYNEVNLVVSGGKLTINKSYTIAGLGYNITGGEVTLKDAICNSRHYTTTRTVNGGTLILDNPNLNVIGLNEFAYSFVNLVTGKLILRNNRINNPYAYNQFPLINYSGGTLIIEGTSVFTSVDANCVPIRATVEGLELKIYGKYLSNIVSGGGLLAGKYCKTKITVTAVATTTYIYNISPYIYITESDTSTYDTKAKLAQRMAELITTALASYDLEAVQDNAGTDEYFYVQGTDYTKEYPPTALANLTAEIVTWNSCEMTNPLSGDIIEDEDIE